MESHPSPETLEQFLSFDPYDYAEIAGHVTNCARCLEILARLNCQGPPGTAMPPHDVTVPGYTILGKLGQGGMGVVYQARQQAPNRLVALKMIGTGALASPPTLRRFRTEAEAAARLQHPNIVQIYEVGEHEGRPFFSMEFVDGCNLRQKVAEKSSLLEGAAPLMETLARAIHIAHQHGVIHRDLKSANVLLTKDNVPKITDFGLAKLLDSDSGQTQTGQIMGTPEYMAPEQAEGKTTEIGPLADVYGLGAILYELLTGRPPFQAATPVDTLFLVKWEEPQPPRKLNRKVPRDLETICLKCLEKEPGKRYASALDLAEDLRRFLNNEPIRARPVGPIERTARWCRRNPLAATLVLTAGAAVVGLFLWWSAEQRRRQQAHEYLNNLRSAIEANEQIALAVLRAGRFASAEQILQQACRRLDEEGDPAALRLRLEARRDRVHRLVRFYQLADEVERLVLLEEKTEALVAAEEALSELSVLGEKEWWAHLPDADLTPPQREHLQNEVYRQILFVAGLRAVEAAMSHATTEKAAKLRSALELVALAEDFRPSRSGSVLNRLCRFGLREPGNLPPFPRAEPTSAVDYYFMGVAHFLIHAAMDNPVIQLLRGAPKHLLGDLDFQTPLPRAEQFLSKAAAMEPQHYFTYLFLSAVLRAEYRHHEAELVANTCVGLRPDYAVGYEGRAVVLADQAMRATDSELKSKLIDQAMADYSEAIRLDPNPRKGYWFYDSRGFLYACHRQWGKAAAELGRAVELLPNTAHFRRLHAGLLARAGDMENYHLARERMLEHFSQRKIGLEFANIALACAQAPLPAGDAAVVLRMAQQAVDADPRSAHARYGLGAAYYRLGEYETAVASLNESLKLGPGWASKPVNWPLLAMAHFRLGQGDNAKQWLDQANELHAKLTAGKETYFSWLAEWWWDGVEFENPLSEANALIGKATSVTNKGH